MTNFSRKGKKSLLKISNGDIAYTNRLQRLPPEHQLIFAFTTLAISLGCNAFINNSKN